MNTSQNLTILPATAADAGTIGELVKAAYARWVPVIGREPRPMVADYAAALVKHRIDLLRIHGRLIGLIETLVHDDHLWIENVAVDPAHHGQGHGGRLLAHAAMLARAAGLSELRLLTNAAFASNVSLYGHIGYEVTTSEPFMGGTTLYMRKRLS